MSAALPRWLSNRPPAAAVEINPRRVTAAVIANQGGTRVLTSYAGEPLPTGAVDAALNGPNIHDADALTSAIRSVLDRLSSRPKRIALVLPDTVGKLSLVRFEKIPAKVQDLDQLIRWQVRKTAPFKIEDAQVSWIPGIVPPEGGREYVVTVARRDIIQSYERACEAAGAYPGIVDLATVNLINAVLGTETRLAPVTDWLLVHVAADYSTMAVIRGSNVIFFRTRASDKDDDLADLVHHEDRLGGGGFARVVLAGASLRGPEVADLLRRELESRLGSRVEALDFRNAVALRDRIAAAPELLDSLAPAIGLILRERVA
jgi:Tfp pilus assembly PilM family ATPase